MSDQDRDLLRRFEPVIRFTRGEQFQPLHVAHYVEACSLWRRRPDAAPELLIPAGELTVERLTEVAQMRGDALYYLRFIEEPDLRSLLEYGLQRRQELTNRFRAGRGRLARVGYLSRFIDLLFSVTLLARGRVPGDASAAAALAYKKLQEEDPRYTYFGRVVRDQGWTVLQYWFFYAFNNWRTGFFGVNDHEADWEMINIYLYQDDNDALVPEWVAYASHDFSGDDLRRRWDDPEVEKVGCHPVIYAGAGSHASYHRPGEYLAEIEISFLSPLARLSELLIHRWDRFMGELGRDDEAQSRDLNVFRVPFVDYARGDGLSIGPEAAESTGPQAPWDVVELISADTPWVADYRGLWGLHARDPISGENAPAGPMYNRDGTVRRAWYDPLGWAGLDKQPPPPEIRARVSSRLAALATAHAELENEIAAKSRVLGDLGVVRTAILEQKHLRPLLKEHNTQIDKLTGELANLRLQRTRNETLHKALASYRSAMLDGEQGPLRAHISRAHEPATAMDMRSNRLAELWAAVSVGLMMILIVGLAMFARDQLILGLVAMISLFVFIESGFRRQLAQLINSVAIGLAIVALLVTIFQFFWQIVIGSVLFAGAYVIWENLRELRHV